MSYKNIQSVEQVYESEVRMLRFRLNGGWDYVWVTYDDVKGFISITSSYGNYSYIWSSMGEGTTLREFFARAGDDYIAEKMFGDSKREKYGFDCDLAIKELKVEVIAGRRDGTLNREEAREYFAAIVDFEDEHGSDLSRDMFMDRLFSDEVIGRYNSDIWDAQYGRYLSGSYKVLRDEVIPLIKEKFRKDLKLTLEEQV